MPTFSATVQDTLDGLRASSERELDDKARIGALEARIDALDGFMLDAARMIESLRDDVQRLRR